MKNRILDLMYVNKFIDKILIVNKNICYSNIKNKFTEYVFQKYFSSTICRKEE